MRKFLAPFIFILCWQSIALGQQERILNYHTDLEVQLDRSVIVKETIEVYASGNIIKRGITRKLPRTRDLDGKRVKMKYNILEVKKNDLPEPYLEESSDGDIMLYFGSKEVFLTPGVYTYQLTYEVPNQIAFFENYDEIYWNAIGNDVTFNVEKASCTVQFPASAKVSQQAAYTGSYGEKGFDFEATKGPNQFHYQVTRPLRPREGLSVAIGFEKGLFEPPNFFARFGSLLVILFGTLFLIPYYVNTWWKYGQDPPTPAAYPNWDAGDELSPASINYIDKGNYQSAGFTASIINLAIKGFLKIEEVENKGFFTNNKYFDLIKIKNGENSLPVEEKKLMRNLFASNDRVSIDGTYDSTIEQSYDDHEASLTVQHWNFIHKGDNSRLLWLPILITLGVAALSIFIFAKSAYADEINLISLFIFIPTALLAFFTYIYLIKKPTVEKLELRSRLNGFRMYLELAEKDRLNLLNPPELTPEHFEQALPYAFALGVAHQWTKKFETILEQAQYRPEWNNSVSPIYFTNHFNRDFSGNLRGATTKPSSSGGSGGGGFSGGGGGGGGVGGW